MLIPYVLSIIALTLQHQRWVTTTEAKWPAKLKITAIKPLTEQVCQPLG